MNKANSHFVHHVLFYLKNPNSAEDKAQLIEGLQALSKVPCIIFSNIGSPANTTRDIIEKDYTRVYVNIFSTLSIYIYIKEKVIIKKYVNSN